MQIPFNRILNIEELAAVKAGRAAYWIPNPNPYRYFFGPSAIPLKKGEGYYQNAYLLLNSASVGITNNISIGAGFEIISTVTGHPVFFITPKVGFKVADKFHAGVGVLYANFGAFAADDVARASAGVIYGVGTYGSNDHNITGGLGWGFFDGEFSKRPVVSVSGMTRLSRRLAFVSENYVIPPNGELIVSYGLRFFGEKIAVDLGFINQRDIFHSIVIGIPYVDFVIKFN